jgi:hypothetical protein
VPPVFGDLPVPEERFRTLRQRGPLGRRFLRAEFGQPDDNSEYRQLASLEPVARSPLFTSNQCHEHRFRGGYVAKMVVWQKPAA